MPARALAWGPDGHEIIATIAARHLTPEARQAASAILAGRALSDEDVAVWADDIRKGDRKETGPWHYVDIPLAASGYDAARDCKDGNCVVEQIARWRAVLADPHAAPAQREEALKFVVHLVGDLHMPVHCADRLDRGGNERTVVVAKTGEQTELHKLWDYELVRRLENGRTVEETAAALDAQGTLPATATGDDVIAWTNEGHRLAQTMSWANADGRTMSADESRPVVVDDAYLDRVQPVIARQLEIAGLRLAAVLNAALTPASNGADCAGTAPSPLAAFDGVLAQ